MSYVKSITILAAAMFLLAIAAPGASALRSIGLRGETLTTEARAPELVYFESPGEANIFNVTCEVTRMVSLNRAIQKTVGAAVGTSTANARNCVGGEVTYLFRSVPITYRGFTGTLPNITSLLLQLNGFAILIEDGMFLDCLYRGNPRFTTVGNPIREFRWDERFEIVRFADELTVFECPRSMRFFGVLRLSNQTIRMTLI